MTKHYEIQRGGGEFWLYLGQFATQKEAEQYAAQAYAPLVPNAPRVPAEIREIDLQSDAFFRKNAHDFLTVAQGVKFCTGAFGDHVRAAPAADFRRAADAFRNFAWWHRAEGHRANAETHERNALACEREATRRDGREAD